MKQIDHDPHEFKNTGNGIWWAGWALVALSWAGYLYFRKPDWVAIIGAFGTGCLFAGWVMDMKYGKRLRDD